MNRTPSAFQQVKLIVAFQQAKVHIAMEVPLTEEMLLLMETRSLIVEMVKRIALGWTVHDKYALMSSGVFINFDTE